MISKKDPKLFGRNRMRTAAPVPAKTSSHSFTGKQLAESYDRATAIRMIDVQDFTFPTVSLENIVPAGDE